MPVGVFLLYLIGVKRWRVTNTLTDVSHVTYGEEERVVASLLRQSEEWKIKRWTKHRSDGWLRKSGQLIRAEARAEKAGRP